MCLNHIQILQSNMLFFVYVLSRRKLTPKTKVICSRHADWIDKVKKDKLNDKFE